MREDERVMGDAAMNVAASGGGGGGGVSGVSGGVSGSGSSGGGGGGGGSGVGGSGVGGGGGVGVGVNVGVVGVSVSGNGSGSGSGSVSGSGSGGGSGDQRIVKEGWLQKRGITPRPVHNIYMLRNVYSGRVNARLVTVVMYFSPRARHARGISVTSTWFRRASHLVDVTNVESDRRLCVLIICAFITRAVSR